MIDIVNSGGLMLTSTLGAVKFISISGAVTIGGVSGAVGGVTWISTGFNDGRSIFGASNGLLTFKLITGFTTSRGISILGVIVISSFCTAFGRTFAIIWISTSGSWTCNNVASP